MMPNCITRRCRREIRSFALRTAAAEKSSDDVVTSAQKPAAQTPVLAVTHRTHRPPARIARDRIGIARLRRRLDWRAIAALRLNVLSSHRSPPLRLPAPQPPARILARTGTRLYRPSRTR